MENESAMFLSALRLLRLFSIYTTYMVFTTEGFLEVTIESWPE